jgi:hypothetical protein
VDAPEEDPEGWLSVEPDGCWSAVFVGHVLELPEVEAPTLQKGEEADANAVPSPGGLTAVAITQVDGESPARVELYDSGATRHISPYCDTYRSLARI